MGGATLLLLLSGSGVAPPPTTPVNLLAAINTWFLASSLPSSFPGGLWHEELERGPVYPCVVVTGADEQEPGECLEQHLNRIQFDIYASKSVDTKALSLAFHKAFMPSSGRLRLNFTDYTETTTLFEDAVITKRNRPPTKQTGNPQDNQLWRSSRMYTVVTETQLDNP